MAIERIQAVVRCDLCKEFIEGADEMVDASVYGITAHWRCLREIPVLEVVKLLNLDDITIGRRKDFDAETGWWKDGATWQKLVQATYTVRE